MNAEVISGGRCRWRGWMWCVWMACSLMPAVSSSEIITLGQRDWEGARAITHVLKEVMQTHLGYQVRIVESDDPGIFEAMHEGKGRIDVLTDLWKLNQADQWAKYIEGYQTVVVNDQPYIGQQGLFIPGYIQDRYQIQSVYDLANPEVAKLFDSDQDGKGEYWSGALGWSSTHVEQVKAKSYGYDKYFKPQISSDRAFKAKLKAAFEKRTGILFYYWTPEWIHAEYDLRQLQEPPFDGAAAGDQSARHAANGCWHMLLPRESAEWLDKSRVTCAWPDAEVYVGFSASLFKRAPRVAQFLKQVAIKDGMLNHWILQIGKLGRDPVVVAEEWVQANAAIVKTWLANIPH